MSEVITKYGYIYKITNKINGKVYIGKRVGGSFDERYWGSGTKLLKAINEFGKHNFEREIIEWCSTKDILRERERYWIQSFDSRNPDKGYNIKKGREGNSQVDPKAICPNVAIISLQLPDFVIEWLKQQAKEECTSVSYIIRRTIMEKIISMKEEDK